MGKKGSDEDEYIFDPNDQPSENEMEEEIEVEEEDIESVLDDDFEMKDFEPISVEMYAIVNLDKRLAVKLKRHEFEPPENAVLGNLRGIEPVKTSSEPIDSSNIPIDDRENNAILNLMNKHGNEVKDDYLLVRNSIQGREITLGLIKCLAPSDANIEIVCDIYEILRDLSAFETQLDFSTFPVYESIENVPVDGLYRCRECNEETGIRYVSQRMVMCASCFDQGKYPIDYESKLFECQIDDRPFFKPHEIEKLKELAEVTDDWEEISAQMGKDILDCKFVFSCLDFYPDGGLKDIIGDAENPVMSLIDVLSKALHPGLGSHAAKIGMEKILQKDDYGKERMWKIAEECFQSVIEKAQELADDEELRITRGIQDLNSMLIKRMNLKSDFLYGFQVGQHQQKLELASVARLIDPPK